MAKIPLSIITGFLGSGKTTFLSEVLQNNADKKLSIIVNEFGEAGLDNTILNQAIYHIEEKTILLQGGCICCSKREDLVFQLKKILNNGDVEHIIIETTGLANPAPIIFSLLTDSVLQHHFFVNEILTCVDCLNVFSHLKHEEARLQIAISDKVVLTKQELFNGDLKEIVNFIVSHNAFVEILPKNRIDFKDILIPREIKRSIPIQRNLHQDTAHSLSISLQEFLDWNVFSVWLSMLLYKYG
ncbi:MAG: GTP-binding protein, partial [Helicobacter sp.]|nr:GTP-binding protein [Helicobacter sp.]